MRTQVLSATLAAVLMLSACGQSDDPENTASAPPSVSAEDAKSTSIDDIKVDGEFGEKPKVSFESPLVVEKAANAVLSEGTGPAIAEGEQVTAQMTLVSGTTGEVIESSYDSKSPAGFPMDSTQISQELFDALNGVKVGSRVIMSLNGSAQQGQPAQTLVYVIDVENSTKPLTRAEGKKLDQGSNPVTVTWAENGAPSISKPKGEKPSELETFTTIEGTGPEVKEGQSVAVNYSGWLWEDNSTFFDSSWQEGREPFAVEPVGQAQVIDGWNEGLIGHKVGSQIVLVIPPEKGYGAAGSPPNIPENATLVFVIDILSAQG